MSENKCPECGAELNGAYANGILFKCGTVKDGENIYESKQCLRNQLEQAKEKNRKLKLHIQLHGGDVVSANCEVDRRDDLLKLSEDENKKLQATVEELQAKNKKLLKVYCAGCGEGIVDRDDPDYVDKMATHILQCEKHPLTKMQNENVKLKESLVDLQTANIRLIFKNDKMEKLQAMVDKLPKTADGVPIVPGMKIYLRPGLIGGKKQPPREVVPVLCGPLKGICEDLLGEVEEYRWTFSASDCYSTREAAEAAREGNGA